MTNLTLIRKVFQGPVTRQQMFSLFDRHAQHPNRGHDEAHALYAGEWFEIPEAEHDYMFEILPPLWIRGAMFAMREFITSSVTSVFYALRIEGLVRYFHGYCDLSDQASVEAMRLAIVERESRPVRAMTREERLEYIWSTTADAYKGYAGDRWPPAIQGERTVILWSGGKATILKLLADLTDDEVAAKLPVQFRHLPCAVAA